MARKLSKNTLGNYHPQDLISSSNVKMSYLFHPRGAHSARIFSLARIGLFMTLSPLHHSIKIASSSKECILTDMIGWYDPAAITIG